ncbi:MAG: HD domain-containing protein [Acidobacteria bacterium]|nr:HD domain-containing protein [Acidobacteriota bacterium]MCA1640688.1 HD domain-containing protein [Acidobacteriota bacterium]
MPTAETAKLIHAFAALADLGEEIAATRDFDQMVRSTLHVVLGALGIRRGAVAECDAAAGELRFVAAWGMGDDAPASLSFDPRLLEESLRDSADPAHFFERHLKSNFRAELERLKVGLVVPLVVHGELVGAIMLGGKATEEAFTPEEREVVATMARHIGVGIYNHRLLREVERRAQENRKLYEDLRAVYRNTVRAFAIAIDCKDKYTQGHSERVGKYTEIIARELGWGEEEVDDIAIGGYLHDVGKLIVDRDIINAPYKIDAKQSSELNRHPAAGFEILSPLHQIDDVIPTVARYHHERIDGRGYPEGLTGEQIPLCAKIVSAADAFDAMTTDRTYKRRKEFPEVVEDFRKTTGKQFAPEVVVALFSAILKEVDGETRERRFARLLGRDYLQPDLYRPLIVELLAELGQGERAAAETA